MRQDLRKAKQWALADKVRDELKALGVIVEDRRRAAPGGWGTRMRDYAGQGELLYGRHAVLEALRAGRRRIHRVYLGQGVPADRHHRGDHRRGRQRRLSGRARPRGRCSDRVGPVNHQGVVAEAGPYPYVDLDDLPMPAAKPDALYLVLDHLQDVQNLGTLLRTAEAMAVTGVLLPDRRAAGITPAVVNASAGAVEHLRIAAVGNLVQALERLKKAGAWVVGLDAGAGRGAAAAGRPARAAGAGGRRRRARAGPAGARALRLAAGDPDVRARWLAERRRGRLGGAGRRKTGAHSGDWPLDRSHAWKWGAYLTFRSRARLYSLSQRPARVVA